jgi:epoxide hydrolase-like predicted phosphatase
VKLQAVIFDLGGVLMRNGGPADFTSRFPDADPAVVLPILMGPYGEDTDHPWHRVERGEITLAECRAANRRALAEAGLSLTVSPGPPTITFVPNDEMVALVVAVRAAGLRTGLLTNNVREFRERWWTVLPYGELFDDVIDSHECGMRKPNPAIYELALERLGVRARATAFLDDIETNVAAARAVGMHGVLVVDDGAEAIADVRRLAGLSPRP